MEETTRPPQSWERWVHPVVGSLCVGILVAGIVLCLVWHWREWHRFESEQRSASPPAAARLR